MKNIITITQQTIQEAFARKVFIAFFVISSLVLAVFLAVFIFTPLDSFLKPFDEMIRQSKGKIQLDALSMLVRGIENAIAMPLFGLGLFLSIFSVSSFIPTMLEKGHVDVILSKPVSRTQVLIGKFTGGLLVVFFNVAYLICGIWLMLGLKFSVWDTQFLYTVLTITFTFAVFYSLIILIGVISQNSILSMMVCYFIFLIVSPLLAARESIFSFIHSDAIKAVINGIYYILPKTSELGSITGDLVRKQPVESLQPVYSSALFMIGVFIISVLVFRKKDY